MPGAIVRQSESGCVESELTPMMWHGSMAWECLFDSLIGQFTCNSLEIVF